MAGYRRHISVSGFLGVGFGVASYYLFEFTPVQGALAGVLTWVAGMLPDLDSQSGKPVREIFSLLAAMTPLTMMGHLLRWGRNPEEVMLLAVLLYGCIRYGSAWILEKLAVHRGMFHSIPAMLIAAELAFLAFQSDSVSVRLLMAGGVAVGFLSHLLLDELYSVEWSGVRIRLNKYTGSAFKLFGGEFLPNVVTYALLAVLSYAALVDVGLLESPKVTHPAKLSRQAFQQSDGGETATP
jgi:hypothetical protein